MKRKPYSNSPRMVTIKSSWTTGTAGQNVRIFILTLLCSDILTHRPQFFYFGLIAILVTILFLYAYLQL